jgi:hypothetical protein
VGEGFPRKFTAIMFHVKHFRLTFVGLSTLPELESKHLTKRRIDGEQSHVRALVSMGTGRQINVTVIAFAHARTPLPEI